MAQMGHCIGVPEMSRGPTPHLDSNGWRYIMGVQMPSGRPPQGGDKVEKPSEYIFDGFSYPLKCFLIKYGNLLIKTFRVNQVTKVTLLWHIPVSHFQPRMRQMRHFSRVLRVSHLCPKITKPASPIRICWLSELPTSCQHSCLSVSRVLCHQ